MSDALWVYFSYYVHYNIQNEHVANDTTGAQFKIMFIKTISDDDANNKDEQKHLNKEKCNLYDEFKM